jgi:ubiquinone biosynthesis monooxygenase Coq7
MADMDRQLSVIDQLIAGVDGALRTVFAQTALPGRPNPGAGHDCELTNDADRRHVAGLMRVNHAGEVAAQGLYQGQAATAQLPEVRDAMEQAAAEEVDHLAWCQERLTELGSRPSLLGPIWYAGAFAIGAGAGLVGDRWSLGFVAETERQVVRHLEDHLGMLPATDDRSRAILEQMKEDELAHGSAALSAGGAELPRPVRTLMTAVSKIMTRGAYWI